MVYFTRNNLGNKFVFKLFASKPLNSINCSPNQLLTQSTTHPINYLNKNIILLAFSKNYFHICGINESNEQ
jgi:hypothetical protein